MSNRLDLSLPRLSLRWWPVWRRNLRVWRKLAGPALVGNLGEPLLYLLGLGYGLGSLVGAVQGMPYIEFLASGMVCASAMNTATFEGLYSAYTRMAVQNTWASMLAAPLAVDDILLGEVAWAASKSVLSALAIVAVAGTLGLVGDWRVLWVAPAALLIGFCFGAMALVVTAVSRSYDFFLYYFTLIVTPMFLVSGVFFPLESMPRAVQAAASWFPLAHAVGLVRPLMSSRPVSQVYLHAGVLLSYGLCSLYLSALLLRRRLRT